MGEYFNEVKLGTCSHLMYVNRVELEYLAGTVGNERNTSAHSFPHLRDYLDVKKGFLYRFPRKHEQAKMLSQISEREPFDYIRLELPASFKMYHKERSQFEIRMANGQSEYYNASFCPLDPKHFDKMYPTGYGGWAKKPEELAPVVIEIVGNQYSEERPDGFTVFRCPCCDAWVSCNSQEIEEYIKPALIERGLEYEAQHVRPYIEAPSLVKTG